MNSNTGSRTTTARHRTALSIAVVGLPGFGVALLFIGLHCEVTP